MDFQTLSEKVNVLNSQFNANLVLVNLDNAYTLFVDGEMNRYEGLEGLEEHIDEIEDNCFEEYWEEASLDGLLDMLETMQAKKKKQINKLAEEVDFKVHFYNGADKHSASLVDNNSDVIYSCENLDRALEILKELRWQKHIRDLEASISPD